jgi:hypothetical protein
MKLCKLTTAASVLFMILAASCKQSSPASKKGGPPESAVREYLQTHELSGLTIEKLEIDSKPGATAGTFVVQFKSEASTPEDLVLPVASMDVFDQRRIRWDNLKDVPQFYEIAVAKETKYANSGRLDAEWHISDWAFSLSSLEGKRPIGQRVSTLAGSIYLVVDSPEAVAYFERLGKAKSK